MIMHKYEFFNHSDGSRVRVPFGKCFPASLVRERYRMHTREIETTIDLRANLRAGKLTSFGCYPTFFLMVDGAAICHDCMRASYRQASQAIRDKDSRSGWLPVACDVNYEEPDLTCDDCNQPIESAYGEAQ
jgi:hypothetical protein